MAESVSILNKWTAPHTEEERGAYFLDLNLNQILDKLAIRWGQGIRKLYSYFPADAECEAYRRDVYADVKKEKIYAACMKLVENLGELEEIRSQKSKVKSDMQRSVWQIREIDVYCRAFDELYRELSDAQPQSEGMVGFLAYLREYLESPAYRKMKEECGKLLGELIGFRFTITYEKDRMIVSLEKSECAYEAFLETNGDKNRPKLVSPFFANNMITELENSCLEILAKKRPEIFKALSVTAEAYKVYENDSLMQFYGEIPFYLSFRGFQREMEEQGFAFCRPTTSEEQRMEARGLYDIALAAVAVREGRRVVSNDMYYGDEESFFVLTGPNQGGKTTFARSLGQLVYFTKMGLDVPASSANVHYFKDIQTHFSVEESIETGRGKLKEELIRLAPMMEDHKSNTFVIINELFTTAASYDARIMGGKVLTHFIELGCQGIYVTHLKELTEIHPRVVSLRAMLNEERLQTFEIRRSAAEESACAANQVNKYRLTYEQLKERL